MWWHAAEERISLSNIIKSSFTESSFNHQKIINLKKVVKQTTAKAGSKKKPEDVKLEAKQILAEAREKAEIILKKSTEEYERNREKIEQEQENLHIQIGQETAKAREKGYEDGFQQGISDGRQQFDGMIEEANGITASAKEDYHKRLEESTYDILDLAVNIARKITVDSLDERNERWLTLVNEALKEVKEHEEIRLYVHHDWYDFVIKHKNEFGAVLKHTAQLFIYPDAEVKEHTCMIETASGRIDASVDSQLGEIKKKLLERLDSVAQMSRM